MLGDWILKGHKYYLQNPLLTELYSHRNEVIEVLASKHFGKINHLEYFSKELSESMAMVRALTNCVHSSLKSLDSIGNDGDKAKVGIVPWDDVEQMKSWHVIDLACGHSLTTAILLA